MEFCMKLFWTVLLAFMLAGNAGVRNLDNKQNISLILYASSPKEAGMAVNAFLSGHNVPEETINRMVDKVSNIEFDDAGYSVGRPRSKEHQQFCIAIINKNGENIIDKRNAIVWATFGSARSIGELRLFQKIAYEFVIAHETAHCRKSRVIPEIYDYKEIWEEESIADEIAAKELLENQSFDKADVVIFLMNLIKARTASVIAYANIPYWTAYGLERSLRQNFRVKPSYSFEDLAMLDTAAAKLRAGGYSRNPDGAEAFWKDEVKDFKKLGFPSPKDVSAALRFRMDAVEKMMDWGFVQRPASR